MKKLALLSLVLTFLNTFRSWIFWLKRFFGGKVWKISKGQAEFWKIFFFIWLFEIKFAVVIKNPSQNKRILNQKQAGLPLMKIFIQKRLLFCWLEAGHYCLLSKKFSQWSKRYFLRICLKWKNKEIEINFSSLKGRFSSERRVLEKKPGQEEGWKSERKSFPMHFWMSWDPPESKVDQN